MSLRNDAKPRAPSAPPWVAEDVRHVTSLGCSGILLGTLVGYEMAPAGLASVIAAGILVAVVHEDQRIPTIARAMAIVAASAFAVYLLYQPPPARGPLVAAVYDRDGVVEIDRSDNLVWDGLWHSRLSRGNSHVGSENWLLATAGVLVHPGPIDHALVVGVGAGITVGTLARIGEVKRVDAYDINRGLELIFNEFPSETLDIARDPKVRLLWQDGRSGLALRPDTYDLVTQQPTYLKQAGSSILLSREGLPPCSAAAQAGRRVYGLFQLARQPGTGAPGPRDRGIRLLVRDHLRRWLLDRRIGLSADRHGRNLSSTLGEGRCPWQGDGRLRGGRTPGTGRRKERLEAAL